jgi:hypothetical protein
MTGDGGAKWLAWAGGSATPSPCLPLTIAVLTATAASHSSSMAGSHSHDRVIYAYRSSVAADMPADPTYP